MPTQEGVTRNYLYLSMGKRMQKDKWNGICARSAITSLGNFQCDIGISLTTKCSY